MKDSLLPAELIAVGSELLLGGRHDTNSLFLTEGLSELGVEVRFKSQVGDLTADIVSAVRTACRRARIVVVTGGLGSTLDDRTREAVARAVSRPLRRHAEALAAVRGRLAGWKRPFRPRHLRQAFIPDGATLLHNPVGSAPGFLVKWRGAVLVALPGVPAEAAAMFGRSALPVLRQETDRDTRRAAIVRRAVHTFGLSETEVEARLRGLVGPRGRVRLGLLASPLGVTVSVTSIGPRETERGRRKKGAAVDVDGLVRKISGRLRASVYGEGLESMEDVVGRLLSAKGLTVSVAESCTGGLIGHRLTQVPGSSAYVESVIVSYSNRAKEHLLDVPGAVLRRHGAVSVEVAAAMARGVRRCSAADLGLSVTGIAGPGGATERKPVGLVHVGLDAGDGRKAPVVRTYHFHGDRRMIKLRASQAALDLLRRHLTR